MNIAHIFQQGGAAMYLLLLLSLTVLGIGIERIYYYRKMNKDKRQALSVLSDLLQTKNTEVVQGNDENFFIKIMNTGLKDIKTGVNPQPAMERRAMICAGKMRQGISFLSMAVTLSPVLGLLGTILGMMQSFQVLDIKDKAPMAITGGVSEALLATAFGLCIAAIALIIHTYLSHRLNQLIMEMEYIIDSILNFGNDRRLNMEK